MKIRIKGDSLRIRVTKSEIEQFGRTGILEEKTNFGNNELIYILQCGPVNEIISADFTGNKITVTINESIKLKWTTTELVGFENKMDIGQGKHLFLLIEKDFVCLDNTFEDQSDNFPNPNAACGPEQKEPV